jgi:hypothetical protein
MTPDLQKKAAAVAGFVVLAVGILYYELRDTSPSAPPAPAAAAAPVTAAPARVSATKGTGQAKNPGATSAQLDPTLKMEPMLVAESLVYAGTGRNIFSVASAPIEIPQPKAPARPKTVVPVYTPPPGPPPPPPIDLKFFGTESAANGSKKAFFLRGDDVYLAGEGDIVQRRYKIITLSANSAVVEDMSNQNRQTLPLMGR